jgi:hypothetical protein
MFPYQKNLALEQYKKTISTHVFTSHFVYLSLQEVPRVRRLRLNIETKKSKKVHPLYLFLLTGQIPYTKKFYPSWKNSNSQTVVKTKAAINRVQVCVRPANKFIILDEIITQIIPKQLISETPIWGFQDANILVFVPMASLTKSTALLQAKNNYFPNFALTLHFAFSNTTAFQKLFFLRIFKIIQSKQKIKSLDIIE